jgi:Mrp family chromosome partitioning ATPase
MLTELFERRLVIVLGKGGVGKTTLSAGLALCAARRGLRVLAMETDSRAPLAAPFGVHPSFDPVEVEPRLSTMVLDGGRALDEYLGLVLRARAVLKAVFASRLYQFFVQAAPGLRELMMLGKVYYEVSQKKDDARQWDLVIVDAPASGQALSLLKMPTAARATFGNSIVGHEADNIGRMLHDRRICALVEVATPETLAVSELIESRKALAAIDLHPAAVVLNRAFAVNYNASDLDTFRRRAESSGKYHHLDALIEIARGELERAGYTPKAHAELSRHARSALLETPDFTNLHGSALLSELASFFASRLNIDHQRHGAAGDDRTAASGRNVQDGME